MKSTTLHPMEVAKRAGVGGGSSPELESRVSLLEDKVAGLEEYSTDEVDTGKEWIDGKRIYRKIYVTPILTTTVEQQSLILDTIEDIDIIGFHGRTKWGNTYTPFPFYYNLLDNRSILVDCVYDFTSSEIKFRYCDNRGDVTISATVIIEYTKTTD